MPLFRPLGHKRGRMTPTKAQTTEMTRRTIQLKPIAEGEDSCWNSAEESELKSTRTRLCLADFSAASGGESACGGNREDREKRKDLLIRHDRGTFYGDEPSRCT